MNAVIALFVGLVAFATPSGARGSHGGGHYGGSHYSHSASFHSGGSSHIYHHSGAHTSLRQDTGSHTARVSSSTGTSVHYTHGYTRKNGTHVRGYRSTNRNSTRNDNFSTRGNVNPYTGQAGTKAPDGQ